MRQKLLLLFTLIFIFSCSSLSQGGTRIGNENFPLKQRWSLTLKSRVYRIAVSEDLIVASQANGITAIDPKTGNLLWELSMPVDTDSLLLFLNKDVVVASNNQMKIINKSGEVLSTIDFDAPKESAEIVAGYSNYVFVRRVPSWSLEVYYIPTGQLMWEIYIGRGGLSINFDNTTNTIYLTTTFFISANDISTGNQIWKIDQNTTTGTFDTEVLYYSSEPSKRDDALQVSAIDTQSLNLNWTVGLSHGIQDAIYNLKVFDNKLITSTNFGLLAFDTNDGSALWKSETNDFFYGEPVFIDDVIYQRSTTSSMIYAISPADGHYIGNLSLEKSSILNTSQREYDIVYGTGGYLIFPFENSVFLYH